MDLSVYDWMERVGLVDWVLLGFAVAGPGSCALLAAAFRRRPFVTSHRPHWVLAALAGPLLYILWKVYNVVVDSWGLDSVAGLGVNAALFAGVALAVACLKLWLERLWPEAESGRSDLP